MGTHNLAIMTKKIYDTRFTLFTLKALRDILEINEEGILFNVIKRLIQAEVLSKIERGKYQLEEAKINNFALANFIYDPSYISFETALNFHGILSQFPYEIISATPKKPIQKVIDEKVFSYVQIKKNLFWGYEKQQGYLIAEAEKALLDQLYLSSKGLRIAHLDEYDLDRMSIKKLKDYIDKFPRTRQFIKMINTLKLYIHI